VGGGDVGWGIADHQAVLGLGSKRRKGGENDVGGGLAGEAVGALHLVEEAEQAELVEDGAGGRGAFGGGGGFASGELGEAFRDSRVDTRLLMAAAEVGGAVVGDELFALLEGEAGEDFGEAVVQMEADEGLQVVEIGRAAGRVTGI
jgi:hypothetical protein